MKHHIRQQHKYTDNDYIEDLLPKCPKSYEEAKNYVDPGVHVYRGRKAQTSQSEPAPSQPLPIAPTPLAPVPAVSLTPGSDSNSMTVPPLNTLAPIFSPDTLAPQQTETDDVQFTVHLSEKARLTIEEFKARKRPYVPEPSDTAVAAKSKKDDLRNIITSVVPATASCTPLPSPIPTEIPTTETTESSIAIPDVILPPVPSTLPELTEYLRFLGRTMAEIDFLRDMAKERLARLVEQPSLEQEQAQRRKLESENQELKRQLNELKRQSIFGDESAV